jgi:hypothetical protein
MARWTFGRLARSVALVGQEHGLEGWAVCLFREWAETLISLPLAQFRGHVLDRQRPITTAAYPVFFLQEKGLKDVETALIFGAKFTKYK